MVRVCVCGTYPHTLLIHYQFAIVFVAMLVSTVPMSILGARFAMGIRPFWTPDQYS